MNKLPKTSTGLDCSIELSEDFIADDDNVYTAPIMEEKDILEFVQSSKNIIGAYSDDENKINNTVPVHTSSEMRNVMKSIRSCLDAHYKGFQTVLFIFFTLSDETGGISTLIHLVDFPPQIFWNNSHPRPCFASIFEVMSVEHEKKKCLFTTSRDGESRSRPPHHVIGSRKRYFRLIFTREQKERFLMDHRKFGIGRSVRLLTLSAFCNLYQQSEERVPETAFEPH
ncbi:hypothetical protein TNCV_4661531 [Trichonephila clavipes]|uniref:Uncharacterized protein n=1 Tax=Trichonephila clavipes TaxID=2585209 RepID=A0A8X6V8L1_TRICX|nr:hypothetical protein TNCV_4661531 [Trichonephila clavipes]